MPRLRFLLTLIFFLSLAATACAPLTPVPGAGTPGADSTQTTPTPRPTARPSATPRPSLGVDGSALNGQVVTLWHAWTGDAASTFDAMVADFNQSNTWGITATAVSLVDYNSLYYAVNDALESGTAPDVVVALPEQSLVWQADGRVVDLAPYIGDPEYGWDESRAADFLEPAWTQDVTDGARLGVPAARSARFLFYNQTWARELGFDKAPATAADFRKQACAANATFRADADEQNDGLGGFLVDWQWQGAYAWLLAFGGGALDENGAYAFDTAPNLAALTYLTSLRADGCAWYSDVADSFTVFKDRKALFIAGSLEDVGAQLRVMRQANSGDQWTVIPFPGVDGARAVTVYGPSYTLLDSGDDARQLAAWLAVGALLEPENQAGWVQATGTLPLTRSALEALAVYRGGRPQWGAAVDALDTARDAPRLASWRLVKLVLADGVEDMFRSNLPSEQLQKVTLQGMDALAREITGGD